jgi:uncharacterized protein
MEDILASIKRVIAEEKEIRAAAPPPLPDEEEDVLELDESMEAHEALSVPPVDLGPPLMEDQVADSSRLRLEELASVAASAPPPPQVNPLEEMLREMLRPILKQWLDEHLPAIVDEHVKREIHRITGRPL